MPARPSGWAGDSERVTLAACGPLGPEAGGDRPEETIRFGPHLEFGDRREAEALVETDGRRGGVKDGRRGAGLEGMAQRGDRDCGGQAQPPPGVVRDHAVDPGDAVMEVELRLGQSHPVEAGQPGPVTLREPELVEPARYAPFSAGIP